MPRLARRAATLPFWVPGRVQSRSGEGLTEPCSGVRSPCAGGEGWPEHRAGTIPIYRASAGHGHYLGTHSGQTGSVRAWRDGPRRPAGLGLAGSAAQHRGQPEKLSVLTVSVPHVDVVAGDREIARVIASAALRAAVAWTRREDEPRAWRELSRMTGVLMHALGPGQGPASPLEVVEFLRHPLAKLLGPTAAAGELGDLVLLDAEDRLTDAAVEVGCEYTEALFGTEDPGQGWLPPWAWQQAEQVQRRVFEALIGSGSEADYAAARRFLIEHPAGDGDGLTELMNEGRVRRVASYEPVPADRVWRARGGVYWWPCPVCRWPMGVRREAVECGYSHHQARFRVDQHGPAVRGAPRLVKVSPARLRVPPAQPVAGARCVEMAVWRFITVPGVPELDLERRLLRIGDVAVDMWPGRDRLDLAVRAPAGSWEVDVKDHADPITIVDNAPAARDIVVPDYRRAQVKPLARAMPGNRVWTISGFVQHVRSQVSREAQ